MERRFEYLFGQELQTLIKERPVAWLPLGPLEKHGEHLPWGLDGLKAHSQCLRLANRIGGVVHPPLHVGIHDAWHPDPEECRRMRAEVGDFYIRPETLRALVEDTIDGLGNIGFRVIVLNSGHYPKVQGKLLKEIAAEKTEQGVAKVIAFDEDDAVPPIDHAGKYETSMFLALGHEVHLERVHQTQKNRIGYWREATPPTEASLEFGTSCLAKIESYLEQRISEALESLQPPVITQ